MEKSIDFSVLISVYKKENPLYLKESLRSVFDQTLRPSEVILVEDGPLGTDLYEVLDEFEKNHKELVRIRILDNVGLGKALNEGLSHCRNELVVRMDSDDISQQERFERQVSFMLENPEISASSSWITEFSDSDESSKKLRKLPLTNDDLLNYMKKRSPLNHPAVIFRKSAVQKAGGYEHFPLFEDYFLWIRMALSGSKFANIGESLLLYRTSEDMYKRRGGWRYVKNNIRLQKWMYKKGFISFSQMFYSILIRSVVYLAPNSLRKFIYTRFLREKSE